MGKGTRELLTARGCRWERVRTNGFAVVSHDLGCMNDLCKASCDIITTA